MSHHQTLSKVNYIKRVHLYVNVFSDTGNTAANTTMSVSLDTQISGQDLDRIAREYLTRWEPLATTLGLTEQQEISIKENNRQYDDQKLAALCQWKKNKGNKATYRAFIEAAKYISNQNLADNVSAMLGN